METGFAQGSRANLEEVHRGPDTLGQFPNPFPVAEAERVPALAPLNLTPEGHGQGPKNRGCLGPVVGFWRGAGRFLSGRWR